MPNGFAVNDQNNSPNSSQLSGDQGNHDGGPSLISRTQKQHITQQVIEKSIELLFMLSTFLHFDHIDSFLEFFTFLCSSAAKSAAESLIC